MKSFQVILFLFFEGRVARWLRCGCGGGDEQDKQVTPPTCHLLGQARGAALACGSVWLLPCIQLIISQEFSFLGTTESLFAPCDPYCVCDCSWPPFLTLLGNQVSRRGWQEGRSRRDNHARQP